MEGWKQRNAATTTKKDGDDDDTVAAGFNPTTPLSPASRVRALLLAPPSRVSYFRFFSRGFLIPLTYSSSHSFIFFPRADDPFSAARLTVTRDIGFLHRRKLRELQWPLDRWYFRDRTNREGINKTEFHRIVCDTWASETDGNVNTFGKFSQFPGRNTRVVLKIS